MRFKGTEDGTLNRERMDMSSTRITTDHKIIRKWADERGGKPARVETEDSGSGLLRIEFPEAASSGENLKRMQWPSFFKKMDEAGLAFLFQEKTRYGETSRFYKIVYAPQGILKQLHEEHEQIRTCLDQLNSTTVQAVKTRPRMLEKLRLLLVPHMKAEEKVFYKPLKHAGDGEGELSAVFESREEHRLIRKMLSRLEKADPESPKFTARVNVLKELVEHHVDEEEQSLFDLARNRLEAEELDDMLSRYETKRKKKEKKF